MIGLFMKYASLIFMLLGVVQFLSAQETGKASYYADKFEGRKTASGEIYKHQLLTAAHKTLPFGSCVKVTNLSNGKSVIVRINDRGPFVEGRIIDLSKGAAEKIGGVRQGVFEVKIEMVKEEGERIPFDTGTISKRWFP